MENNSYIVAIDLGSSSVKVAAASKDHDGRLNIIDLITKPLEGMSCGEVTNIEQVTSAARAALVELEANLGIKVSEAYTGISGQDIKSADSSYFVYVSGEDHEICEEDVIKLHESMTSLQPPEGVCILDRTPQKYVIDSNEETMQPVGRFGQQLEATFNFTLGSRSTIERLSKAFSRLGIRQRKLFTDAQATAAAVLTEDEKELGAAVIDIGAGCTDICIWQDNIMRYVGVVPVGADSINRDIRSIAIPERFIEKLKIAHGYAVAAHIPDDRKAQSIKIKGRTQRENKEISFFNLAQIIEARMVDIVEAVIEEIKESGYAEKLGAGIVLTGGGAMLRDVEVLFRERTKYDVRVGASEPNLVNDSSLEISDDMRNSSVIGLLLLGMAESNMQASDDAPVKKNRTEDESFDNNEEQSQQESEHKKEEKTIVEPKAKAVDIKTEREEEPETKEHKNAPSFRKQEEQQHTSKRVRKNANDYIDDDEYDNIDQPADEKPLKEKAAKPEKVKKGLFGGLKNIFTDIFEVVDDDEI